MTEEHLERETLGWLADAGYSHLSGLEIAPDGPQPERSNYSQVLLLGRLRDAINLLNPLMPAVARDDALQQVLNNMLGYRVCFREGSGVVSTFLCDFFERRQTGFQLPYSM